MLAAMRACPEGKPSSAYGDEIGYSYDEASKSANLLCADGLAVWAQLGHGRVWTATEHGPVMRARCAAEIAAIKAAAVLRKREACAKYDLKRRGRTRPKVPAAIRYRWPEVSVYEAPRPLVSSVWALAEMEAA